MRVKKIWVKSIGNPVPRPWPDTRNKPPITSVPVQVVDTPAIRRYINHPDEPLVECEAPKPKQTKKAAPPAKKK